MCAKKNKQIKRSRTEDPNKKNMFTYINNGIIEPYKQFKVDNFYANR